MTDFKICKTHSKTDLVELINTLNLPVINSHQDNKKSIQLKIVQALKKDIIFSTNCYNITNISELKAAWETSLLGESPYA